MISLKDHVLSYDKIVIGYKFNAIAYAYLRGYPLIVNNRFQYFPCDLPAEILGNDMEQIFKRLGGDLSHFKSVEDILANILFDMEIHGLLITNDVNKITIVIDKKFLLVNNSDRTTMKIQYGSIMLFDDDNIIGLPLGSVKFDRYKKEVIDWFDCCVNNFAKQIDQGLLLCENKKLYFKYRTNNVPEQYEVRLMLSNLLKTDLTHINRMIRDPKKNIYKNINGVVSYE